MHSGAVQTLKSAAVKADINVTPLVDVVLVLLIIFMVFTPLIKDPVRLPVTANPALREEREEKLLISIDHDGATWARGHIVPAPELAAMLKDAFSRSPGTEVVLKADAALRYGDVKRALLTARDAGFDRVGLITNPDPRQEPHGVPERGMESGHRKPGGETWP